MKSNSPSAIATALIEILNRLTPEEKKEFARAFNWDEFERIRKETVGSDGRKSGDPKVYVEGSPRGINFDRIGREYSYLWWGRMPGFGIGKRGC